MTGPVAYLTGEYPRATDTFIQREVAALRAQGIEVLTCSIRRTGRAHHVGPEQQAEAAATFNVIAAARRPARLLRAVWAALRAPHRLARALLTAFRLSPGGARALLWHLFYLVEAIVLADHLRRHGVTHLHNHIAKASCTVALLVRELTGIPYSFTLHGPDIFFEPYTWRLDKKIAKAAFVACISDFCRSQAMAFSAREHWDKLHIVHCGIDPDRYAAGDRSGPPRALFVGRLAAVKGLPVLFDALRALRADMPDLRMTLVGDGPEREALQKSAADLGDMVEFLGYRSQDEVAGLLRDTQLLVLPSFAEGLPVVLMEAMAAGLPVVATRIAGVSELVQDGISGRLVPPGNVGALTEALREVLGDAELRARMGQAGGAKVRAEFRSDVEAAKLAALFRGDAP